MFRNLVLVSALALTLGACATASGPMASADMSATKASQPAPQQTAAAPSGFRSCGPSAFLLFMGRSDC
jgi:hypothetical protein